MEFKPVPKKKSNTTYAIYDNANPMKAKFLGLVDEDGNPKSVEIKGEIDKYLAAQTPSRRIGFPNVNEIPSTISHEMTLPNGDIVYWFSFTPLKSSKGKENKFEGMGNTQAEEQKIEGNV
jgi:hypothetical protein